MVKHTQTIRRQKPTKCLSVFDHFVGLALRVKMNSPTYDINLYLGILLQKYIRIKEDKKCKVLIFKESSKTFYGNFWKCDTQLKKDTHFQCNWNFKLLELLTIACQRNTTEKLWRNSISTQLTKSYKTKLFIVLLEWWIAF